jgi:hypothetical protein
MWQMSHLVKFFKFARIVDPFKARILLRVHDPRAHDVRAGERGMGLIAKLARRYFLLSRVTLPSFKV